MEALKVIQEDQDGCRRCKLCETRTNIVFGEGNPNADWLILGEAPGQDEDLSGRPFVGRSGQLLDSMLSEFGYNRNQVYITNVACCRPPENRPPEADEIAACSPFLMKKIQTIRPRVISTLGGTATKFILNSKEKIGKLRGKTYTLFDSLVIPTYHPSYILRGNKQAFQDMRADFSLAIAELALPINRKS